MHLPALVNHRRARVCTICRAVAACMLVAGCFLITKRLAFALLMGKLSDAWGSYMGVGEFHEFSLAAGALAIGSSLAFCSRSLARWIVVIPSESCPACGYSGITPAMTTCPECGLTGFAPANAAPQTEPPP